MALKKEAADRQVLIQGEEIRRLEEVNAGSRREVLKLQEELERQKRAIQELEQVRATAPVSIGGAWADGGPQPVLNTPRGRSRSGPQRQCLWLGCGQMGIPNLY